MTISPYLLGAALAFWGWHIGLWWLGLALGVLAELPRALAWRWELGLRERWRVADLCSALLVLAGVYLYLTQPRLGSAMLLLIQWLPALLFPLLAVQLYGDRGGVELSVLLLSLRRQGGKGEQLLDLRGPYLLTCLLAAAMVPTRGPFYYPLLALLGVWALWPLRALRTPPWRWAGLVLLAAGLGFGLAHGLQRLQLELEEAVVGWLSARLDDSADPYRATTAIGEVGELKLSERIILRVRTDQSLATGLLLRSASYNRYFQGNWLVRQGPFQPLIREAAGWRLPGEAGGGPEHWLDVHMELQEGRGIVPLPPGPRHLQGLKGAELLGNEFGVLKVLQGPEMARYRVDYGAAFADTPPNAVDLRLPEAERGALDQVVEELGLDKLDPPHALERLQAWLLQEFSYDLRLHAPPRGESALEEFLLHRRSGHCEYFASAAVLLLRRAGIPARYAVGWSLQEYSPLEQAYVVRARHAHAWALVWVDGGWRNFDPTPPSWAALEAEQRPWWSLLQDLISRASFLLAVGEGDTKWQSGHLAWLLIPLVAFLAWRILRRGRSSRRAVAASPPVQVTPFTPVEAVLARRGAGLRAGETLAEWLQRLEQQGEPAAALLRPALELYYRQRFDPAGLDAEGERLLEGMLEEWLQSNH